MKAEDLMIGDWVICNYYQDKPFYHQFGLGDFMKGGHEFCEPIPLTPEILEKNRFKKVHDGYDVEIPMLYWDKYTKSICCENHHGNLIEIFNCCYVHELQHALKLCGIEKEIVL